MSLKIEKELENLVSAKVISPQVKNDIEGYYKLQQDQKPNMLFAIFGVLGSLLVGLGIILILAHNWDNFSRTTKTTFAFVPLVIGQLFVAYSLFKNKSVAWKETAATFLFFAVGASIALISQVYNIRGDMDSFLLTWIVLAAPLVYLLRSHAAVLLHLIFCTIYACNVGYFNDSIPWLYIALLGYVIPFYRIEIIQRPQHNLTGVYHWLVPLSVLISLGAFVSGNETLGFLLYISLFGLFYNIGKLSFFATQKLRNNGYLLIGSLGTVITLLIATFNWVWHDGYTNYPSFYDMLSTLILLLAALVVLVKVVKQKPQTSFNLFQYAFLIFAGIYGVQFIAPQISILLTNILVFTLGVFAIRLGTKKNRYSILNYGLLIITSLIACRFFDINISFVVRGLLFVAIGIGFFTANYIMYKKQIKLEKQNPTQLEKVTSQKNNNHE